MNREEMFALARGQSCSLTEMKEKHCIDSWDLFAGEKNAQFQNVYETGNHLPRSKSHPHLLYLYGKISLKKKPQPILKCI